MKENEAQDDKMDTAIQDAENKKDAYLKKKREEEENKETEDRLKRIKNLEDAVINLQQQ
jgi:hypothetical protein